jgi:hypothetical protein
MPLGANKGIESSKHEHGGRTEIDSRWPKPGHPNKRPPNTNKNRSERGAAAILTQMRPGTSGELLGDSCAPESGGATKAAKGQAQEPERRHGLGRRRWQQETPDFAAGEYLCVNIQVRLSGREGGA